MALPVTAGRGRSRQAAFIAGRLCGGHGKRAFASAVCGRDVPAAWAKLEKVCGFRSKTLPPVRHQAELRKCRQSTAPVGVETGRRVRGFNSQASGSGNGPPYSYLKNRFEKKRFQTVRVRQIRWRAVWMKMFFQPSWRASCSDAT